MKQPLVLDGRLRQGQSALASAGKEGSIKLNGKRMGCVKVWRGHMALLSPAARMKSSVI